MTSTSCPTFHDTSLPVLTVPANGTLRIHPSGRIVMPTALALVIVNSNCYGVVVGPDRVPVLVREGSFERLPEHRDMEASHLIIANHGQKLSVAGGYWVIDASDRNATPSLGFC
jgi:hypothetical protein